MNLNCGVSSFFVFFFSFFNFCFFNDFFFILHVLVFILFLNSLYVIN